MLQFKLELQETLEISHRKAANNFFFEHVISQPKGNYFDLIRRQSHQTNFLPAFYWGN